MRIEYGLFDDQSDNYTEEEAVEAGFFSVEEAQKAIAERYQPDDDLVIHRVEEPDDDDEEGIDDEEES